MNDQSIGIVGCPVAGAELRDVAEAEGWDYWRVVGYKGRLYVRTFTDIYDVTGSRGWWQRYLSVARPREHLLNE